MIVFLLRLFVVAFPAGLLPLYFHSYFAVRLKWPLPLISMIMSLLCGLNIFWVAIFLHHFIGLYHITLSHYVDRTCGIACIFLYY